eukprot:CAMPEP_0171893566 /NCGR_PEP_ID=MMETSP0992-20121227/45958_1 /TAXON_ID=483369 /ORGANISM="non described non described, Strain CCMP2098" /LENGTH=40 /DNA_ID= /DNA_START= /DNA_END= /DNA_ORIENTATION=
MVVVVHESVDVVRVASLSVSPQPRGMEQADVVFVVGGSGG